MILTTFASLTRPKRRRRDEELRIEGNEWVVYGKEVE
jgi:hypothetical protein